LEVALQPPKQNTLQLRRNQSAGTSGVRAWDIRTTGLPETHN
jgi:hypothetical protein